MPGGSFLPVERNEFTCLLRQNVPQHIFPGKVQKDVELSPEASTKCYERGNTEQKTLVRARRGIS